MSQEDAAVAPSSTRRGVSQRWSRTALVGLAAVAGVTIMGTAGLAFDKLTGSDLVALGGTLAAILGTVAGRPQNGGGS